MHITAIIPARGGSKGIPGKNLRHIANVPLITHSIQAALQAEKINQVIVTTDDATIAQIAVESGAEIIMRPAAISSDTASSESALLHALDQLDSSPDLIVFLQCTTPLTTAEDIDTCIQTLIDQQADSAFTATPSHRFLWKHPEAALSLNHQSHTARERRQDREPEYAENGAVYVMRTEGFKAHKNRFFGKTVFSLMPATRSWEIDALEDLKLIEALLAPKQAPARVQSALPKKVAAVVFDFDGVFTDNGVYLSEAGVETVRCDRGDGWGVGNLHKAGVRMAVMSSEVNPVVTQRCAKLKLECFHKLEQSKYECFEHWCKRHQLNLEEVVFIGNDENDIDCLKAAGCGVVPADAHASTLPYADLILTREGGRGAVRELCDLILELQNNG